MKKDDTSLLALYIAFFRIGLFAIGGGYAMLPPMIAELVDRKKWVDKEEILNKYAVAQSIPGVIAINTSALLGYKIKRFKGSIAAVLGEITPSILIILLIARAYTWMADNTIVEGALKGIRIAVLALLLLTVIDLTRKSVKDLIGILLAICSFVAIYFLDVSPIFVILAGMLLSGLIYYRKEKKNADPV